MLITTSGCDAQAAVAGRRVQGLLQNDLPHDPLDRAAVKRGSYRHECKTIQEEVGTNLFARQEAHAGWCAGRTLQSYITTSVSGVFLISGHNYTYSGGRQPLPPFVRHRPVDHQHVDVG